ncbi:MAG: DUF2892 domain-containing protein [Candidatus Nanohaloarchaea archaeon]
MEENIGDLDKKIRLFLGALFVVLGFAGFAGYESIVFRILPQTLGAALMILVGAVLLATGYTSKCPLYQALGLDTSED